MNATYPAATAIAADNPTELKATDRCDRCGARATNRATLPNGLELLFCGHHARSFEDALKEQSITLS